MTTVSYTTVAAPSVAKSLTIKLQNVVVAMFSRKVEMTGEFAPRNPAPKFHGLDLNGNAIWVTARR